MTLTQGTTTIIGIGVALVISLLGASPAIAPHCPAPPSGLIAWWSGDTDAQDISGNNNHVTLQGGSQAGVAGLIDGAFAFDSATGGTAVTNLTLDAQGSIEFWVNPTTIHSGIQVMTGTFAPNSNDHLTFAFVGPNELSVNLGFSQADDFEGIVNIV